MKLKTKWTNSKTLNYDDTLITSIPLSSDNTFGVVHNIGGKQIFIADDKGKLQLFDAITLKPSQKPLNQILEKGFSEVSSPKYQFTYIDNQLFFFGLYVAKKKGNSDERIFVITNLNTGEIFNHTYEDETYIDKIFITCTNNTFYALVIGETIIDKWDIKARKIVATSPIEREWLTPVHLCDNIIQMEGEKNYFNFDIDKMQLINEFLYEYPEGDYFRTRTQHVKLNSKWVNMAYRVNYVNGEDIYVNLMFDSLTGKKLVELSHEELIKLDGFPSYYSSFMREEISQLPDKEMENLSHFFSFYLNNKITTIPTYLGEEPVVENKKTGEIYSLKTFKPIEGIKSTIPPQKQSSQQLYSLAPLTLLDNNPGFIISIDGDYFKRRAELWNPFGKERDLNKITYIKETVINGQDTFVTVSSNNTLSIHETKSGKQLGQSMSIDSTIKSCTLAKMENEQILIVCLENNTIEFYDLPYLHKRELTIHIKDSWGDIFAEEFEGRMQLFVRIGKDLCTWDIKTGEPIHQPIQIKNGQGQIEDLSDVYICPLRWNDNLVLAITEIDCDSTFLWNLDKGEYIGNLDLNAKVKKNADPDKGTYDIVDIRPIELNGQKLLLTISAHGVLAFFDYNSSKQTGTVKNLGFSDSSLPEFKSDYAKLYSLGKTPLLLLNTETELHFFDLIALKKLKKLSYEDGISSFTISDNTLIVCHGEEITATEISE